MDVGKFSTAPKKSLYTACILAVAAFATWALLNKSKPEDQTQTPAPTVATSSAVPADTNDPSIQPITPPITLPAEQSLSEFDNTLAELWVAHAENNAVASFELINGGVTEGGLAIEVHVSEVTSENNLWDIQLVKEDIPIKAHQIQTYSAWVKGSKGAEVSFAIESPEYLNFNNRAVILTGDWQQVAFEFVADTSLIRAPVHFASKHNKNANIIIDEIEIR